jgi:acetoin:2,6-dichlorophenolindophenol oxidoreductase subunit alpha
MKEDQVVELAREQLIEMYRRMMRIRSFEEQVVELAARGELPGAAHTSIGEEATVVGACMALRTDDYMVGTHRSHGHPIGKGADLKRLFAELLGKSTGVNRGKGGSMHLADFSIGSVGETSIVGSGLPVAAGAALGAQVLGQDRVALCFFGDGASNEGAFHEALNLAAVWDLPAVFVCENNGYAVSMPASRAVAVKDIADRAKAYDMPGVAVDGQDPIAVYEVVHQAVERARSGNGPSIVEAKTYRYREHAEGFGGGAPYRTDDEVAAWRKRDPVPAFRARLIEQGVLTSADADSLDAAVHQEVADALEFARRSDYPAPEEAFEGMYSTPIQTTAPAGLAAGGAR